MSTAALWTRMRRSFGPAPRRELGITVQYVGVADKDVDAMQSMFDAMGEQLGVTLELRRHRGEMVLLQLASDAQVSMVHIEALTGGRPAVFITRQSDAAEQLFSVAERLAMHQRVLLPQLSEMDLVRRRSALPQVAMGMQQDTSWSEPGHGGTDRLVTSVDSRIDSAPASLTSPNGQTDAAQLEVLQRVLLGMNDPATPKLAASYGPEANLLFDFSARLVKIDSLAQQHLRVRRELPRPQPLAKPHSDAMVRELDETIWHMGLASGHLPLIGEPEDWARTALAASPEMPIERFTRMPRHLEMARRLVASPVTPSELRRHAHVSSEELRNFLQACLFLNIVRWVGAGPSGEAARS